MATHRKRPSSCSNDDEDEIREMNRINDTLVSLVMSAFRKRLSPQLSITPSECDGMARFTHRAIDYYYHFYLYNNR